MNNSNQYNEKELISFWNTYYKNKDVILPNSDFSEFTKKYLEEESSLIDLGCGDGRDAIFFSEQKVLTTGVDFSNQIIEDNKNLESPYLTFSVVNLNEIENYEKSFDYAYCRFLFHAVSEKIEDKLFLWLSKNINKMIFIETRVEDDISRKSQNEHYRRYFKEEDFIEKILISGFKISNAPSQLLNIPP